MKIDQETKDLLAKCKRIVNTCNDNQREMAKNYIERVHDYLLDKYTLDRFLGIVTANVWNDFIDQELHRILVYLQYDMKGC